MIFELQKVKTAQKKKRIVERIDSPELLVASLRFYLARLAPGKPVPAAPLLERQKYLSRKFKTHLWAVRRLLGIAYNPKNKFIRLPLNYWKDLRLIGLEMTDFDTRQKFEALNGDLVLDKGIRAFVAAHPGIIESVKDLLREQAELVEPTPATPLVELDDYGQHVQAHVTDCLAAWRGD